jgi:elongator complex protein 1
MERKVGSGRKGTVDEEEYLLKSLTKLAGRLVTAQGACLTFLLLFQIAREEGVEMRCCDSGIIRRGRGASAASAAVHHFA